MRPLCEPLRPSLRLREGLISFAAFVAVCSCHETTATGAQLHERWLQPQNGYGLPRPAISGGLAYFGTGDGVVIARDQRTGGVVWSSAIATEQIGGANMVVTNGLVVVPVSHETVALNAVTGKVLWRYSAPLDATNVLGTAYPGQVLRTHLAADAHSVYVPAWGASVSAIDALTGNRRWLWEPSPTATDTSVNGRFRSGSQGAVVSGDTVYATAWHYRDRDGLASEAWLVAINAASGVELWRLSLPPYTSGAFVRGAPVVSGELVIFETAGGHEFAIQRFTRQMVWEYTPHTQHATGSQTELYDGVVYHDGGDGFIYALDAATGAGVWQSSPNVITSRDMLVTARRVIFVDGRMLHVLDRSNGRELIQVAQPRTSDPFLPHRQRSRTDRSS
jgi:outer membrane protein assembly factor BamB